MKLKSQLSMLVFTIFLVSLASTALVAQSTPTDEQVRIAAKKSRTGRTRGMTLEEAQKVVVNCLNKASGFMAISNTRKVPLNRLEDTLEDLGITDTTRLNTLRRYLVRNEEIGVQSVSRVIGGEKGDETPLRFYRFMVTSHDLLAINRSQKLSEVIQLIAKIAGYSEMPIDTAYQILADCTAYAGRKGLLNSANDAAKIDVTDRVDVHFKGDVNLFANCVAESPIFGVPSVDFDSAHGDTLKYELRFIIKDSSDRTNCQDPSNEVCVVESAVKDGFTYECLAKLMTKTAFVKLPSEALAGELVMTAIMRNLAPKVTKFNKDSSLGSILKAGGVAVLVSELELNIGPQTIDLECVKEKRNKSVVTQRTVSKSSVSSTLDGVSESTTVMELIKKVEEQL